MDTFAPSEDTDAFCESEPGSHCQDLALTPSPSENSVVWWVLSKVGVLMQSEFAAAAGKTPASAKVVAEMKAINLKALRLVRLSNFFIEP
jgi:hypothetical protein